MSKYELMNYDTLEFIEVPVKIDGKEYRLREASGKAASAYRNRLLCELAKRDNGTLTANAGLGDLEPFLVSMCLIDEESKPVPVTVIQNWPARLQNELYDKAREISGMNDEKEDKDQSVKN